ncbi:MAG: hypothetical protein J3K34DRAFT_511818 [Monoraphidium minutum]|nr:MAG: hypothetical protein J3K34DRAFT_511818 [Monoraphidium minutum]
MQRGAGSRRPSRIAKKSDLVQEQYLSDQETGLASAIHDSLKSLFAEPRLPDNPYYYLANVLSAHVDRGPLWQLPDAAVAAAADAEGGAEVADPATRLCRLSSFSNAWGLAHVLRVVSKEGVAVLHDVLTNGLPDSFFPGPMPFSTGDGCTVQGATALWRPRWVEFPELALRADVVVRGPAAEAALAHFGALLQSDLAELVEVPVYFVDSLHFISPAAERGGTPAARAGAAPRGAPAEAAAPVSLEQMRAAPDEFLATLRRCVLGGCCVEVRGVVMLEAPQDARDLSVRKLRFESATKRYYLHYIHSGAEGAGAGAAAGAPAAAAGAAPGGRLRGAAARRGATPLPPVGGRLGAGLRGRPSHYGGAAPHEALFEGVFLDAAAARQYLALWSDEHGAPYSKACLEANAARMIDLRQIESSLRQGANMEGFRRALLLVLLQDGRATAPAPPGAPSPGALLPLEELVAPPAGGASEVSMVLSAAPNLLRMLNSGAAEISGVVREIQAVLMVARLWPPRRQQLIEQAEAALRRRSAGAGGRSGSDAGGGTARGADAPPAAGGGPRASAAQAGASGQARRASQAQLQILAAQRRLSGGALDDPEDTAPQERLAWLHEFQMEAKLLEQVAALAPRMRACSGSGIFAGISTVLEDLVSQLPAAPPPTPAECQAAVAAAEPKLLALQHLMEATELSLADGLLDRCRDVAWVLHRFGIRLVDSVMERASATALAEEGDAWAAPDWVLDVRAATEAQVRSGAVAERVAVEGVMLQYAVDTQLDALLSRLYAELTAPPLALNPYPRLVAAVRAHAARLDLWRDDVHEMSAATLNRLALLAPPSFIYEARPPAARQHGRGGGARGGGGGGGWADGGDEDEGDESEVAYGCYAAVTLCDCRALQALRASLGPLLAERSWQSGAYTADVILALTGDAALSGALRLGEGGDAPWGSGGGDAAGGGGVEGHAAGGAGGGDGAVRPPYEHPRFEGVEAEEHHLVSGPSARAAAALFAARAVECALGLHRGSMHMVHALEIDGMPVASFGLAELLAPEGREAAIRHLVEAVRLLPQGACVARLVLFAAAREGVYVQLAKRLFFQHRGVEGPLAGGGGGAVGAHRSGSAGRVPGAPPDGDGCGGAFGGVDDGGARARGAARWGADVYRRVFLAREHAERWHRGWNDARGDPAQPFHYHAFVAAAQEQARRRALRVAELEAAGRLLDAQKLLLLAGAALQDVGVLFHASRAAHSAAQELRCLQRMNASLAVLLSPDLHPEATAKLDAERARRLLLLYCGRLRRAMTSPRYNYFSGLAAAAPRLVAALKEQLLGSFRLGPGTAAALARLDLWARCCECSVAASVHDCLGEGVTRGLAARI